MNKYGGADMSWNQLGSLLTKPQIVRITVIALKLDTEANRERLKTARWELVNTEEFQRQYDELYEDYVRHKSPRDLRQLATDEREVRDLLPLAWHHGCEAYGLDAIAVEFYLGPLTIT